MRVFFLAQWIVNWLPPVSRKGWIYGSVSPITTPAGIVHLEIFMLRSRCFGDKWQPGREHFAEPWGVYSWFSLPQCGVCIIFLLSLFFVASNQCVHNQTHIDSTHILLPVAEKADPEVWKDECINMRSVSPADNKGWVLTLQIRSSFTPLSFPLL